MQSRKRESKTHSPRLEEEIDIIISKFGDSSYSDTPDWNCKVVEA